MSAATEPTGAQLLREINRAAAARGVLVQDIARKLSPYPANWLRQLGAAARPKPQTIERVRAVIAGEPVPPPDLTNRPSPATVAKVQAQNALMALLENAADTGAPCPSNNELAQALKFKGTTSARDLVKSLEVEGRIAVRRFARSRQITILATGRSTAAEADDREPNNAAPGESGARAEWEARASVIRPSHRQSASSVASTLESAPTLPAPALMASTTNDPRPSAWSRDPCPRCAVRGDLGCAHQQPFQAAGTYR